MVVLTAIFFTALSACALTWHLWTRGNTELIGNLKKVQTTSRLSEQDLRERFEDFKQTFQREYQDVYEHEKRFNIFKANVEYIEERNAQGLSWTLAPNNFTDLTVDEFKQRHLGLNFQRKGRHIVDYGDGTYTRVEDRKSIDWVEKKCVQHVKDQAQCGSCWAFSTIGSVESRYCVEHDNTLVDLSEQELVDCDRDQDQGCNGGLMDNAFVYIEKNGITTEDQYPYHGRETKCKKGVQPRYTIKEFVDVKQNSELGLYEALNGGAVSIAMDANAMDFMFYHGGIYNGRCGTGLDHGVLLVGYGQQNGAEFWKVKNSWGASWGESGFFRLKAFNGEEGSPGKCGVAMAASYPVGVSKE